MTELNEQVPKTIMSAVGDDQAFIVVPCYSAFMVLLGAYPVWQLGIAAPNLQGSSETAWV